MKMLTVAGAPSCGKTSVILHLARELRHHNLKAVVAKFDCISSQDETVYQAGGIEVTTGLAGGLCPDHFFVSNIEGAWQWARRCGADILITESAGLCSRCSPHIKGIPAVCVVDNLSGVNTPRKIGPMLRTADIVVITKGDIVSQAEREVFSYRVRRVNPGAKIYGCNGLSGQGMFALAREVAKGPEIDGVEGKVLRFTMPAALCSYCLGERKVGYDYQIGNTRTMNFKN